MTVGANVTIQAGRAVPNDYEIVTPPELVLSKIPLALPTDGPLVVRNGTLQPLVPQPLVIYPIVPVRAVD